MKTKKILKYHTWIFVTYTLINTQQPECPLHAIVAGLLQGSQEACLYFKVKRATIDQRSFTEVQFGGTNDFVGDIGDFKAVTLHGKPLRNLPASGLLKNSWLCIITWVTSGSRRIARGLVLMSLPVLSWGNIDTANLVRVAECAHSFFNSKCQASYPIGRKDLHDKRLLVVYSVMLSQERSIWIILC